ncbi:MAG: ATP-binding protein, partial [Bacteroidota bacterium]
TALSMGIRNLGQQLDEEGNLVAGIENLAKQTIGRLRDSVWALDIGALTLQDFRVKLHHFLVEFSEGSGMDVEWEIDCTAPEYTLRTELALGLYRMVQEGIHNSLRHGGAGHLQIALAHSAAEGLSVTLVDDGKGFDPTEAVGEGHYGLRNLQARTAALDGNLDIQSAPDKGATLCWHFPEEN